VWVRVCNIRIADMGGEAEEAAYLFQSELKLQTNQR